MKENSKNTAMYAPFILAAVVSLIYHLLMQPMGGDNVFFSEATADMTLWEYLAGRYVEWTSRVVSEFVLVNVIQVPVLWRVLDFLMFATLPLLFARIVGGGKVTNWCVAAAVLIYPFHDMGTAGWITTTVTHFWPLWGAFYIGMLLRKMASSEHISLVEAVIGTLAAIMTGSHEQLAAILLVVYVLYGVHGWMKRRGQSDGQKPESAKERRRNRVILAVFVLIGVISLFVILLCPGNAARNAVSIADVPEYAEFGFGDKLYLGLLSIERVFIANADAVFLAVMLVWTWLVYLKTDDYKKTLVSGLPLLILFGQTVVRTAYPGLSGIFVIPEQILSWSWGELSTWLPMVYLAITVASMIYTLYVLFGEKLSEFFYALILLGCGFGAGMVLGFMATIYVSGERVYAPLYFILLLVTMFAVKKQENRVSEEVVHTGGKLVVTVLALLVLVNIGFITLSI